MCLACVATWPWHPHGFSVDHLIFLNSLVILTNITIFILVILFTQTTITLVILPLGHKTRHTHSDNGKVMESIMERDVHQKLCRWKHRGDRKPLIVRGARQIGKTWSISNFGAEQYPKTVSIDFERSPELHSIFSGDLSPKTILSSLELVLNMKITGEELIFFDEVQACPRAIMALRYFYEDRPELSIIAAGSFLEFALSEISFPVGRVQTLDMEPMTFSEFLAANDMGMLAEELKGKVTVFPEAIHDKLMAALRSYLFVGGLPECVDKYRTEQSMLSAFEVQRELVHAYRQDFSEYASRVDRVCLQEVFHQVALQVGEQIQYTKLDTVHSGPINKKAFDSLCLARLVHKIQACHQAILPLGASLNPKKFKASLVDIGLMQHLNHLPIQHEVMHDDLLDMYRGKLAEQFVAQQLRAQLSDDLFYWHREARNSNAELDFIYTLNGQIIPVEVKSGKSGSLKSLHLFLKSFPDIERGYVYYSGPYRDLPEKRITFMPLYYAGQEVP